MATNVEHRQVSSCVVKVDGQVAAQTAAGPHGQASTGVLESAQVDKRVDCPDMFQFDIQMVAENGIQLLDDLKEG